MFNVRTRESAFQRYSVTRCTFADMSGLLGGAHVTGRNRRHFESKMERVAQLATGYGCRADYGGITGVADAERLVANGWAEGAAQCAQLAPSLAPLIAPPRSIKRRVRWADNGTELNIDRALAGQWDTAYRSTYAVPSFAPKVISLACNFGGSSQLSHAQLFWCAAQMIVVSDLLEQAGYAVELRAVKHNVIGGKKATHVLLDVLVKEAGQPMRADAVAAMFGHAGVYRTFGHTLLMTSPYDIGASLGRLTAISAILKQAAADEMVDSPDYVFEHGYSLEQAARNITAALTSLNVNSDTAGATI